MAVESDAGWLIEQAGRFAAALDASDYLTAALFLTPDCRYRVSSDKVCVGPEAILASYRENDSKARRGFDHVEYSSEAAADESGGVRVTFFDELHVGDSSHTFRCSQIVYFGEDGKIQRIELREIPGERELLDFFCQTRGISLH